MDVDLSEVPHEIRTRMDEIFRGRLDERLFHAVQRQREVAAKRFERVRWSADMMPQTEVDPMIDAWWCHYYGHNYSANADLMKFLHKRNPEIVLRARSNKVMVGYTGRTGRCGRVQFGKGTMSFAN